MTHIPSNSAHPNMSDRLQEQRGSSKVDNALISVIGKIFEHFLSIVCFWRWFEAPPLSKKHITVIHDLKQAKAFNPEAVYQKFQALLTKKVTLIVGVAHERYIFRAVKETEKGVIGLKDRIESVLDSAEKAVALSGRRSPIDEMLDNSNLFTDHTSINALLESLVTPDLDKEKTAKKIYNKLKSQPEFENVDRQTFVTFLTSWLFNPQRPNLVDYIRNLEGVEGHIADEEKKLLIDMLKASTKQLFEIKKSRFLSSLGSTAEQSLSDLAEEAVRKNSEAIVKHLSDRLVAILKDAEKDFAATFDGIIESLNDHVEASLDKSEQRARTHTVADKKAYIAAKQSEYLDKLANTILSSLFPDSENNGQTIDGLDNLNQLFQLPQRYTSLKEEGKKIAELMLPKEFFTTASDLLKEPLEAVMGAQQMALRDQIKEGVKKGLESLLDTFTKPQELEEVFVDSILPNTLRNLKKSFVTNILKDNATRFLPLFNLALKGEVGAARIAETLYDIAQKHAHTHSLDSRKSKKQEFQSKREFLSAAIPQIESILTMLNEVKDVSAGKTLSATQIRQALTEYFKSDCNTIPNENSHGPYLRLVKNLLFKTGQFGKWTEWFAGFRFMERIIGGSVVSALEPIRSQPAAMLEGALDSLDESFTKEKIEKLFDSAPLIKLIEDSNNRKVKRGILRAKLQKLKARQSRLESKQADLEIKKASTDENDSTRLRVLERKFNEAAQTLSKLNLEIKDLQTEIDTLSEEIDESAKQILEAEVQKAQKQAIAQQRKETLPLLIQDLSKSIHDLAVYGSWSAAGGFGKFVARRILGKDETHLNRVIATIYTKVLGKPTKLATPLNRILAVVAKAINPASSVTPLNIGALKKSVAKDVAAASQPAPVKAREQAALQPQAVQPLIQPIGVVGSQIEGDQFDNQEEEIKELLDLPDSLQKIIQTAAYYIKKKFVGAAFSDLEGGSSEGLELLKSFQMWINKKIADGSHLAIQSLKSMDLELPLSDKDRRTLQEITRTGNPEQSAILLDRIQKDWQLQRELARLPVPVGQKLEDYTAPLLKWLFQVDKSQGSYQKTIGELFADKPEVDQKLVKELLSLYLDYTIKARTDLLTQSSAFPGQLLIQERLEKLVDAKGAALATIVKKRMAQILAKASANYQKTIDGTVEKIGAIFADINKIRGEDGISREDIAEMDTCHPLAREIIMATRDMDPIKAKQASQRLTSSYLEKKSDELVELLLPSKNGIDGISQIISELAIDKDLKDLISNIKTLAIPYLREKDLAELESKEKSLVDLFNSLGSTFARSLIKRGVHESLNGVFATVNPEFFKETISARVLPAASQQIAKMMTQNIIVHYLPNGWINSGFAQKLLSLANETSSSYDEAEENLLRQIYEKLCGHLSKQTLKFDEFRESARPIVREVVSMLKSSKIEEDNVEAATQLITEHFKGDKSDEKVAEKREQPVQSSDEYTQLALNFLKAARLGPKVEWVLEREFVRKQLGKLMLNLVTEWRSSPSKLIETVSDKMREFASDKENVRQLLLDPSESAEKLALSVKKLGTKIKKLDARADKTHEDERLIVRLKQQRLTLKQKLKAATKKDKNVKTSKRRALDLYESRLENFSHFLYDFIMFLPTYHGYQVGGTLAALTAGTAAKGIRKLGDAEMLHQSFKNLLESFFVGDEMITHNIILQVSDELLQVVK